MDEKTMGHNRMEDKKRERLAKWMNNASLQVQKPAWKILFKVKGREDF